MSHNTPNSPRRGTLTEREFALACEVLARTGSKAAAILALSAGAKDSEGRPSRRRTLEQALATNPEWAQRWEDAKFAALGFIEGEIAKAAVTVDERPIFDKSGALIGVQKDSRPRNDMLKFLARKLDPDAWSEKRQLQMSGTVEHRHTPAGGFGVSLSPHDVLLLPPEKRMLFVELLSEIRTRKESQHELIDQPARPALDSGSTDEGRTPSGDA